MEYSLYLAAFAAGLIPVLFWVWFWLREDTDQPEPLKLITIAFLAGMAVVPLTLPLQHLALSIYPGANVMYVWVTVEEVLKYAVALAIVFWQSAVDEPIDMVLYLVMIALGFAALENTLFILNPLLAGDYLGSALTGSFRFIGATLLHVLASASIGVLLAITYYKSRFVQLLAGTAGLCIAIALHGLFNFFIMDANGATILSVFLFVWIGIIIVFLLLEYIKQLQRSHNPHPSIL